jgi:hypothetical protein
MKTPRRNFVVEYKTNRRQSPARPQSIWGNLDLQSVARQVEADGILIDPAPLDPHLTNSGKAPMVSTAPLQHSHALVDDHPHAPTELTVACDDGVSQEALPQERPALEVPPVLDDRSIDRKAARFSIPNKGKPSPEKAVAGRSPDVSDCPNGEDDLDALEEENRRLKRLMIIKLRQENAELRSMLMRFEDE